MSRFIVLLSVCLSLTPYLANGMTAEQKEMIHEHFATIGSICMKDNPITEDDFNSIKSKLVPMGPNAPCFMACIMKQIGVMDEQGMVQKETAMDLARSVFNDEEELKIIEAYLHSCSYINTIAVSDGEAGCERAVHSYKCMIQNAAQFGFDI